MNRARRPLPVPLSPTTRRLASLPATRRAKSTTRAISADRWTRGTAMTSEAIAFTRVSFRRLRRVMYGSASPKSTLAGGGSSSVPAVLRTREGHARSIAPEIFESVELAGLAREHVHDEIGIVDQDPVAEVVSLHVPGVLPLFRQALDDGVADRLSLP